MLMTWFEALLSRPVESIPTVFFILLGIIQVSKMVVNLFSSTSAANAKLQQGNQQIITQDNTLQGKLLDEMTARRLSDERFKKSDEQFKKQLMDLLDEKVTRIDLTTIATHGEAKAIRAELTKLQRGLTIIYKLLNAEGAIK